MVLRNRLLFAILLLPLCALFVTAVVDGSLEVTTPANNSHIRGDVQVNATFSGLVNITAEWNQTTLFTPLNVSYDQTGSSNFTWTTTNGSFSDGMYGLRVTIVNSTNQSDNQTLIIVNLTVDNTPPNFTWSLPNLESNYTGGDAIVINITVSDAGGVLSGVSCNLGLNGSTSQFIGSVAYDASQGTCNGTITLIDPLSISDGVYNLSINLSDRAGNTNTTYREIRIDTTPPSVTQLAVNVTSVLSNTSHVNVTVNISDPRGITTVNVGTAFATTLMTRISGNATVGVWSFSGPLDTFQCKNESLCTLRIDAADSVGNSNATINTSQFPLFIDSYAPQLLSNETNVSTAVTLENISLSARWNEIALATTQYVARLRLWSLAGVSTLVQLGSEGNTSSAGTTGIVQLNFTNFTYSIPKTLEGQTVLFSLDVNDSMNRTNVTQNMSVTIANTTPSLVLVDPANNSYVQDSSTIQITSSDVGIGHGSVLLTINVTSQTLNVTINLTQTGTNANNSLFDWNLTTNDSGTYLLANLTLDWLNEGEVFIRINTSDQVGNTNDTTINITIVDTPDIVNFSVNGYEFFSTLNSSATINISNASRELTFNWSVIASAPLNTTTSSFVNLSDVQNQSFSTVPASALYNVTAGKNYFTINVTLSDSPVTATSTINITANVPLNLSALANQYSSTLASWNVSEDGQDVTSQNRFVNSTFDITLSAQNTTNGVPFTATFNYTNLTGLQLRWNASATSFGLRMVNASSVAQLHNETGGNVTIGLEHTGQTAVFFDEEEYFLIVSLNVTNGTPYYQENAQTLYLLESCTTTPGSAVNTSSACFTNTSTTTTVYLPRFDRQDRLLFVEPDSRAPNVTINTPALVNQSVVVINISAYTPNPNTTLCWYNFSSFNNVSNVSTTIEASTVSLTSFSSLAGGWFYAKNITGTSDGQYNLTVACSDDQEQTATVRRNLNVSDTTTPTISNVQVASIGDDTATVSGSANELVRFSVLYGTSSGSLDLIENQSGLTQTADVDLDNLERGTRHFYKLVGCDEAGLCGESEEFNFTTLSPSSSSGGGGGGGGGGEVTVSPVGTPDSRDSRLWSDVAAGTLLDYRPAGVAIEQILLLFNEASERVVLTVQQYSDQPPGVLDMTQRVYRWFEIEHQGIQDKVSSHELVVTVDAAWVTESAVLQDTLKLYRLEDGAWVAYDLEREGDLYRARVPGFSWFAVAGEIAEQPVQITDTSSEEFAPPDAVEPETEQPALVETDSTFVSALGTDKRGLHPAFVIVGIVILVGLLAVGGLKAYRMYQEREDEHEKQVRKDQETYLAQKSGIVQRSKDHDPMAQLKEYIQQMREKGYDDEHIKSRLHQVGWDSVIVDQELASV